MKYLYSINSGRMGKDIKTNMDVIADAGFDAVDFNLCTYCDSKDGPMYGDNWREWAKEAGKIIKDSGLIAGQAHALFEHENQISRDFTIEEPWDIFKRSFEACALIGTKRLIFHPIQRWYRMPEESMRRPILDLNVEWYSKLLPYAHEWGVQLVLENLFDYKHVQRLGNPVFPIAKPEDLVYVVDQLNDPMVRICLDTGHANINKIDIPELIRLYGSRLEALHLNDNFGLIWPVYEDVHMFPGSGFIEWGGVMKALKEVGYSGTLNMEVNGQVAGKDRETAVAMIRGAREVLASMARNYGLDE